MEKNYGFENFLAVFTPLPNKKKKIFFFYANLMLYNVQIIICYNHDRINEMYQNPYIQNYLLTY